MQNHLIPISFPLSILRPALYLAKNQTCVSETDFANPSFLSTITYDNITTYSLPVLVVVLVLLVMVLLVMMAEVVALMRREGNINIAQPQRIKTSF